MEKNMKLVRLFAGAGLGSALMYWLDSHEGRRRRARLKNELVHFAHRGVSGARATGRDFLQRTRGVVAEARSKVSRPEYASDEVLMARVRSKIGRVISHPHAVQVFVRDGRVSLVGVALRNELDRLLSSVKNVKGVGSVECHVEPHDVSDKLPALQGGRHREERFELFQANWSPTARLFLGTVSLGPIAYAVRRPTPVSLVAAAGAFGLLLRCFTNQKFTKQIRIRKIIEIKTPIDRAFGFWENQQNLMYLFPDVRIRPAGNQRFYWRVKGPGGVPVGWYATVSRSEEKKIISWKSEPGSLVTNEGTVRFISISPEVTRIDVDLRYVPPMGMLGHVVAKLFGADPKSQLDTHLARLKSYLETPIRRWWSLSA
jgi:uncharacterized membrane protein